MIIQIYAFTDPETGTAAVNLGVDQIGFVAGKYGIVQGELSFKEAHEIVSTLPPEGTAVALTMSGDVEEILRMASVVKPGIIHSSSDVHMVDASKMKKLRSRLPREIRLMKAIPVGGKESIELAQTYAHVSDLLLLDTKTEGFPGVGATGFTHDWTISKQIVASVDIPVIMAGGLTAGNVGDAILEIQPWAVDSNTSTNVPGSRVEKDLERIRAFVNAVKNG